MNAVSAPRKRLNKYLLPLILEVVLLVCLNIGFYFYKSSRADPVEKIYLSGDMRIEVLSYTKELVPGHRAHLSVRGWPHHEYNLSVYYYSGQSKADGLGWKESDDDGVVQWNWKVGTRTYPGQIQAVVSDDKFSGYIDLFVVEEASPAAEERTFSESVILFFNLLIVALIIPTVVCCKNEAVERKRLLSDQCPDDTSSSTRPSAVILALLVAVILAGVFLILAIVSALGILSILPKSIQDICLFAIQAVFIILEYSPLILMIIIIVLNMIYKHKKKK